MNIFKTFKLVRELVKVDAKLDSLEEFVAHKKMKLGEWEEKRDIEKKIIGLFLLDPETYDRFFSRAVDSDLSGFNYFIYQVIAELKDNNRPVDLLTVVGAARKQILPRLKAAVESIDPSSDNIEYLTQRLIDETDNLQVKYSA
jgi:hypothetical protein